MLVGSCSSDKDNVGSYISAVSSAVSLLKWNGNDVLVNVYRLKGRNEVSLDRRQALVKACK